MAVWCGVLIVLGLLGLIRDIAAFDIPLLLSPVVNVAVNVAIMLVALGLLIRIRVKRKAGTVEHLEQRVAELEAELGSRPG